MAELASHAITNSIKDIWKVAFGESKSFLDFIFKYFYTPENTTVTLKDGIAVSTAMFLPFELFDGQDSVPASYVYGVATLPEYRRQGLMEEVLTFAHDKSAEREKKLCYLIPQEPYLFDVYKKFGYVSAFRAYRGELPVSVSELSAEECYDGGKLDLIYDKVLKDRPRVLRGERYFNLVLSEMKISGGVALTVGEYGYCIFTHSNGGYVCTEVMSRAEDIERVFSACASYLNIDSCTCISPFAAAGLTPFYKGMVKKLDYTGEISIFEDAYLNVMLD